jgi:hypothetical protein
LAQQTDRLQCELREGPCFAAVREDRLVLANNVVQSIDLPLYGPTAADLRSADLKAREPGSPADTY